MGKPVSDYVVDQDNEWLSRREFEFVSVEVDLEARTSKINWKWRDA